MYNTGGIFKPCNFKFSLDPTGLLDLSDSEDEVEVEENTHQEQRVLKPYEIKAELDRYVIGQEEAKTVLSVAAYNHYRRINYIPPENGVELQKSNVLLVGKSGSGKTLLASTLAKILDVPFVTADVTDFAPTGIVGRKVSDIIKDLIKKADGDEDKAVKGIVFIDEIDKMAGTSAFKMTHIRNGARVMSGEVQSSFLKLLEGKELVDIAKPSLFRFGEQRIFDTKNILFICAGAFEGIYGTETMNSAVGFTQTRSAVGSDKKTKITAQDLIDYGLMPEIVGRIPVIVTLDTLTKDDLVRILREPKDALIEQYRTMMSFEGVKLDIHEDALHAVAEQALTSGTGARGLRTILEGVITKIMFQITQDESVRKCVITKDVIGGADPIMIRRK
jgi:ATP-dependent Clp protease ATP-binding subunit ClpX